MKKVLILKLIMLDVYNLNSRLNILTLQKIVPYLLYTIPYTILLDLVLLTKE